MCWMQKWTTDAISSSEKLQFLSNVFIWQSFETCFWILYQHLLSTVFFLEVIYIDLPFISGKTKTHSHHTFISSHCVWLRINKPSTWVGSSSQLAYLASHHSLHIYHVQLSKCKIVALGFDANLHVFWNANYFCGHMWIFQDYIWCTIFVHLRANSSFKESFCWGIRKQRHVLWVWPKLLTGPDWILELSHNDKCLQDNGRLMS